MLTERLELRLPTDDDRGRFVELWSDEDFMVFTRGPMDVVTANTRFDSYLATAKRWSFARQPVIERSSGTIVGYAGAATVEFEGHERLEFGYRLIPEARGKGYATEAGRALLDLAATEYSGEILALVDPTNIASQKVALRLGFECWKQGEFGGSINDVLRRKVG
jgi:RimJ/RimL family protein N-acetyltransferase